MFCCGSNSEAIAGPQVVDNFMQLARARIRTQALHAEQLRQEAEEARLIATQLARHGDRVGARAQLVRQKRLLGEYKLELDQREALESALSTVQRAIANEALVHQLHHANLALDQLLVGNEAVEEALETLREHKERSVSLETLPAVDESEIDELLAAAIVLPSVPLSSPSGGLTKTRVRQSLV